MTRRLLLVVAADVEMLPPAACCRCPPLLLAARCRSCCTAALRAAYPPYLQPQLPSRQCQTAAPLPPSLPPLAPLTRQVGILRRGKYAAGKRVGKDNLIKDVSGQAREKDPGAFISLQLRERPCMRRAHAPCIASVCSGLPRPLTHTPTHTTL